MNVVICDDHPLVGQALAMPVETGFDARVTLATSFQQALDTVQRGGGTDLCIVDYHIPGEDSAAGLARLRQAIGAGKLLVFSGSESDDDLRIALASGADGFLPKSSPPEVIEAAVRLVLAGGRYIPQRVQELAFAGLPAARAVAPPPEVAPPLRPGPLTERQSTVLELLATGLSNKEIARQLGISPATVKAHIAQISALLKAHNRTEAVANAHLAGLI